MPLDPNTWPLPYMSEYTMNFDEDGIPVSYSVTVYDVADPTIRASDTTDAANSLSLNQKIKELADTLYP